MSKNIKTNNKTYLGDAVYVEHDGYHIILTVENGIEVTSRIYIDAEVLENLENYIKKIKYWGKIKCHEKK